MNRKAWFILTFIAFALVGALTMFILIQSDDVVQGKTVTFVGEKSLDIIQVQLNSTDDLFFLDQSVRQAAYESVFDLAENGGFRSQSECGTYAGLNLWSDKEKRCFPSKTLLELNYVENFKFNFIKYRTLLQQRGLLVSYDYFFDNGEIMGVADTKWTYDYKGLTYKVNPSFREKISHDFDTYIYIQEFVDSLEGCLDLTTATVEQCVNVRMTQAGIKHKDIAVFAENCGSEGINLPPDFSDKNALKFCVRVLDEKFPFIDNAKSSLKNPEIKFAATLNKRRAI